MFLLSLSRPNFSTIKASPVFVLILFAVLNFDSRRYCRDRDALCRQVTISFLSDRARSMYLREIVNLWCGVASYGRPIATVGDPYLLAQ